MKKIFLTIVLFSLILSACKTQKQAATIETAKKLDCTDKNYTYSADIKPIIESNCANCHNTNNKAGYNFLTIASVKKAGEEGKLLGTIKHLKGYPKMPFFKPQLAQEQIDKIECWVNNGMKE